MDCSQNAFCSSLSASTRKILCAHCYRKLAASGSIQHYNDFERHATLILDGLVSFTVESDEDTLIDSHFVPTFYLGVPGRMLATNITFFSKVHEEPHPNVTEFLTDCCVATFEHEFIRTLFNEDRDFSFTLAKTLVETIEDACTTSAILRTNNVYVSVYRLVKYLSGFRIYLTQQQIAKIINRDRASVSRAAARIKEAHGGVWGAYYGNKGRAIERGNPLSD